MSMKKMIGVGLVSLIVGMQAQASPTVAVGVVSETVKKPVDVNVKIYSLSGSYRLASGIRFGGSLQKTYSTRNEDRVELSTGYSFAAGAFTPYIEGLVGRRDLDQDMDYAAVAVGVRYAFNDSVYTNVRYRYRDSYNDTRSWKTDQVALGLGYNVNKTTSVEAIYADTKGAYESKAVAFNLVNRF